VHPFTRGRTAAVLAALAAAPLLLSATAHAEPDPAAPPPDPKAACEAPEFGGLYNVVPSDDGVARGFCQYIVEGRFYYDNYENGTYTGTLVYQDGAKVPTERPQMPENLQLPIGNMPVVPFPGQF
jgi:hypothetical protein